MLESIRSKTSSFFFKVLLGLICITMVIFFGGDLFSGSSGGGSRVLLNVKGTKITSDQVERLTVLIVQQRPFSGDKSNNSPAHQAYLAGMRNQALGMIARDVLIEYWAKEFGIILPKAELKNQIIKDFSKPETGFDPEVFVAERDSYKRNFGYDFEAVSARSLEQQKIAEFFQKSQFESTKLQKQEYILNSTSYNFERIVIKPSELTKGIEVDPKELEKRLAQKIEEFQKNQKENLTANPDSASNQNQKSIDQNKQGATQEGQTEKAQDPKVSLKLDEKQKERLSKIAKGELQLELAKEKAKALSQKAWPLFKKGNVKALEKLGLKVEKKERITVGRAAAVLPSTVFDGHWPKIFRLTKENPYPEAPIVTGQAIYLFKLTDKKEPDLKKFAKLQEQKKKSATNIQGQLAFAFINPAFSQWFASELKKATDQE